MAKKISYMFTPPVSLHFRNTADRGRRLTRAGGSVKAQRMAQTAVTRRCADRSGSRAAAREHRPRRMFREPMRSATSVMNKTTLAMSALGGIAAVVVRRADVSFGSEADGRARKSEGPQTELALLVGPRASADLGYRAKSARLQAVLRRASIRAGHLRRHNWLAALSLRIPQQACTRAHQIP